jgi:transposase
LRVHRETVKRYCELAWADSSAEGEGRAGQNRPNPPTGFSDQNRPNLPAGSSDFGELSRASPASRCDAVRDTLIAGLEQGLSAQRIWQDLRIDGFAGAYDSFKRFVRHLSRTNPPPFRRMECEPGAEAQIDFGQGALVVQPDGKRKRPHAFRIVLSHSRKAYSEVVWRQSTEGFIRCIENAFWHFGGVPRTLVIDNLKAAVSKAHRYPLILLPTYG